MNISPTRNKIKTHAHKLKTFNSNNFHLKIQHHAQGQAVRVLGNGKWKRGWESGLGKCAGEKRGLWKAGISAGNRLLMAIEVGDKQIYEN